MTGKNAEGRPSDEVLALRAAEGCLDSFEELVRRFQVPLVQFLRQRIGSFEDAEDLTQDTIVRAYQNLHRYQPTWRFSTWLFTIARRLCINQLRWQNVRRPVSGRFESSECLDTVEGNVDVAVDQLVIAEDRMRLWDRAAASLSEPKYTALWLFYVEGMSVAEVAKVLSKSRVAVKTLMFRARKELEPILGEEFAERRDKVPVAQKATTPRRAPRRQPALAQSLAAY